MESKEEKTIRETYQISYGLQYGAWELELCLPDREKYSTEDEARKKSENRTVSALLTADAIFLFYDGMESQIFPEQQKLYRFSFLKEETYDRLGPPLSPEDMDRLIAKDMLEEVIFSGRYMVTENDYTEFHGNLAEVFMELEKLEKPMQWEKGSGQKRQGFLFESVWYQAERIR